MTDQPREEDANNNVPPLVRRLREVGFVVNEQCVRPTPERLGELHLVQSHACAVAYCRACEKPLCVLTEVVHHEPDFDYESEAETSDLCLVCATCGVIYNDELGSNDLGVPGVLGCLVFEGGNLIEELKVFEGVAPEDRVDIALHRELDRTEAFLKRQLESIARLRAGLPKDEAVARPPATKAKKGGVLKLVDHRPKDPDPGPSAA